MKTYYLTKEFIMNELGIDNVIVNDVPITIINGIPMVAKQFKWTSIDECKNDPIFTDIKSVNGSLVICETNLTIVSNIFKESGIDDVEFGGVKCEVTEDFKEADEFIARIFVNQ